ncbi:MAG: hypothetical protein PHH49_01845 [Candidatus Omnitrophica bacterium]|nr:hypothetical protein [Candidatus Omnitrophota bacterium]MDD5487688.1 hypothetical protein [Candidatus Omnitrophota bacterium]
MNIDVMRKEFREILEHEKRAKNFYEHYISQLEDPQIKEELTAIRDDEIVHIKLVEQLIDYVK